MLFCMSYFLVVSCVLAKSLCGSSTLFADAKVIHVIVSKYMLTYSMRSTSPTSSFKQLTLQVTVHFALPRDILLAQPSNHQILHYRNHRGVSMQTYCMPNTCSLRWSMRRPTICSRFNEGTWDVRRTYVMAALIDITNPYHLPHHYLIPIKTPIALWYCIICGIIYHIRHLNVGIWIYEWYGEDAQISSFSKLREIKNTHVKNLRCKI